MNQSPEEKIVEEVRNVIFVDQKIVTFNYISKQYNLSIPEAKEILTQVANELKSEGRTDFITSHYITGYSKDSNPDVERGEEDFLRYNVMEADNDELDDHKESFFSRVDSIVLRSIRSTEIKRDRDLYAKPDDQALQVVKPNENGHVSKASVKVESSNGNNNNNIKNNSNIARPAKEQEKEPVKATVKETKKLREDERPRETEEKVEKGPVKVEKKQASENRIKKELKDEEIDSKPVKEQQENDLKRKSATQAVEMKPSVKKSKKEDKTPPTKSQKRITDFFKR